MSKTIHVTDGDFEQNTGANAGAPLGDPDEALAHYARLCIDNMHARIQNYYVPTLVTISMVQGDALGGGFECAMSSDVLVAEALDGSESLGHGGFRFGLTALSIDAHLDLAGLLGPG